MQDDQVQTTDIVAAMGRFAADPKVDVNKIEKLYELIERAQDKRAEQQFNKAMAAAQGKITTIVKKAENKHTHSMYATLDAILEGVVPAYTSEGFACECYEGIAPKEGDIRIMCDIRQQAGHTQKRFMDLPSDTAGSKGNVNKTPIQGKGSTFSYGRRYLMCMIWNVPTGDDTDGNQEETISLKQEAEIVLLINDTGTNISDFYKHYKIERVIELPMSSYPNAKMMLMEKQRYAQMGSKTVTADDLTPKEKTEAVVGSEAIEEQEATQAAEAQEVVAEMMGEPTPAEYAEFKRIRDKNRPDKQEPSEAKSVEEAKRAVLKMEGIKERDEIKITSVTDTKTVEIPLVNHPSEAKETVDPEVAGRPGAAPPMPDWAKDLPS